jgi:nitrite reductase/ring-hydroxylating ferredoxin subunit
MSRPRRKPDPGRRPCSRREALGVLAGAALAAGLVEGGCSRAPSGPQPVSVPLADLPPGKRLVLQYAGEPVELRRGESGAVARALVCTHYGCTVAWRDEAGAYVCPCHAGRFDADGVPVMGPPQRPLRTVPAVVAGGRVRIGA